MRTLVVAGTFDEQGGRPSSLITKLFSDYPSEYVMHNGGHYSSLEGLLEITVNYDVVFWLANVDNSLPKFRNVKSFNPKCILVTSKRNDNNQYCFTELVSRALEAKANLVLEFSKEDNNEFAIRVFDPLGVLWCEQTTDYAEVMQKTYERLMKLCRFTRQSTQMSPEIPNFEVEPTFLKVIHEKAQVFHDLIQPPAVVKRFLGNASFRCTHGFPSFRSESCIVVSRRNVNKTGISKDDFVAVRFSPVDNSLTAYGPNKPSVDSPVQARLYELFPKINYMLHSHVYIKGALYTNEAIPCGAIEEVPSIVMAISFSNIDWDQSFCVNLLGHGSLVFATDLSYFDGIEYEKRPIPELIDKKINLC